MPCFVMVLVLALNSNTVPSVLQCLFLLSLVPCTVAYLSGMELSTKLSTPEYECRVEMSTCELPQKLVCASNHLNRSV